jgi:DNA-binding NtrC family response regulator
VGDRTASGRGGGRARKARRSVSGIDIPPLRDRGDDVLLLADHYLARYTNEHGLRPTTLSGRARAALRAHRWPGNVRELVGRVERAARMSAGRAIEPRDLRI